MHDAKNKRVPYPGVGAEFARKPMPMERVGVKDYKKEDALPKAKKKTKKSALMEELARKK